MTLRTFIIILSMSFSVTFADAQKPKLNKISFKTLQNCLTNLKIEDADGYFLKYGYKFAGTIKYGDSTQIRYKKSNSFQSFGLYILDQQIVEAFLYTSNDDVSSQIITQARNIGFVHSNTITGDNNVSYSNYEKGNFALTLMKRFYEDEQASSFFITLKKIDP